MAVVLEPNSSYNLISRADSGNNKLLVHVKLTDSCLRALEEYQSAQVQGIDTASILDGMAKYFILSDMRN